MFFYSYRPGESSPITDDFHRSIWRMDLNLRPFRYEAIAIRFLMILIAFFINELTAQTKTGRIIGRVVSNEGTAVPDVHVQINKIHENIYTDKDGRFIVEKAPPGGQKIKLEHIAFEPRIIGPIQIAPDSTHDLGTIVLTARILPFEEIMVTATRIEDLPFEVSKPFNIVSAAQIREREVRTSAEALREETGIFVQKTNHGGGSAIIRGLGSNQILILVDGIRLNNSTYRLGNHQYLTTVDPNSLSRIEVVRGPHSVLYGSDALGGTVNLITPKPSFSSSGIKTGFRFLSRYATADEEKTNHGEVALMSKRWAFTSGFTYQDIGDLRRGRKGGRDELENSKNGFIQSPTGFSAYDADSKLVFHPLQDQYWTLAYQLCRQSWVPRYDKYENEDYFRWFYHPQKRDLLYLNFENRFKAKYFQNMRASVSWHRQEEGREQQKRMDSNLILEEDAVNTLGIGMQFNPIFSNHSWVYGLEFYRDHIASRASTRDPLTGAETIEPRGRYPDDSGYLTFGAFWQDQWQISTKLKMIGGGRFSRFSANFEGETGAVTQEFSAWTGSLGLVFSVAPDIHLTGNIGQGFRAPNMSDITKLGQSKGLIYEVPNYDLQPEKMLDVDIGLNIRSKSLKMTLSAYHSRIHGLISSESANYRGSATILIDGDPYIIKSKQNTGQSFIQGIEASFQYRLTEELNISGNLCSAFGHNKTLNEPVGGIPPAFGLLGLKWMRDGGFIMIYSRFASNQDRLSADDLDDPRIPEGGTPGWQILCIRSGMKVFDRCKIQVALENVLDVNYREHGSGVNGPGRNLIVSVNI